MDEYEEHCQELAQQVEIAFAGVPFPGDDNIVSHPNTWIASHLPRLFAGKHWKEIPLEVIIQEKLSLPLFTPEGFRFYLPAFLCAALLYPDQVDILPRNIIFNLTPPDEEGAEMEEFLKKISGFTKEQIDVIKAYVKLYVATETSYPDPDRDRASRFWMQR